MVCKQSESKQKNEIWALHFEGKILDKKNLPPPYTFFRDPRYHSWHGAKIAKPFYISKQNAKLAILSFPKEIQDKIEIVRYIPE